MTDRVGTTGTAWMGLTLSCAQCHTHKYDPLQHTEYFQIMAFLNNVEEPSHYLGSLLPVEQLLPVVGYEDVSSFRKLFQQYTSLTPKAYRERFYLT